MIKIAQRLRPFSHRPGSVCLIPTVPFLVEAFPALLRIKTLKGDIVKEKLLPIKGPLNDFTVMQDLERGCVTVFSKEYQIHILPSLDIVERKNPGLPPLTKNERLSLGSHKKQDWEEIIKRRDFKEILPFWFRLGSLLRLPLKQSEDKGIFSLVADCKKAISNHRPETIVPAFEKLFLAAFGQMFVPRLSDEEFQGIPYSTEECSDCSLYLLSEGAHLIRSLFITTDEHSVSILPSLPPEFFSGRFLGLQCPFGNLDIEWSKKEVREVILHAAKEEEILLRFQPSLRSFRIRNMKMGGQGRRVDCGDSLAIKSDSLYLLDQFQK